MENKKNEAENLQDLVSTWNAIQRYAFYVGVQRGVMSSLNTVCLRFGGISFEDYTKAAFKPQLNQMFTTGQAMQLLGGLLHSINELVNAAMADAKQELEQEKGGNNEKNIDNGQLA